MTISRTHPRTRLAICLLVSSLVGVATTRPAHAAPTATIRIPGTAFVPAFQAAFGTSAFVLDSHGVGGLRPTSVPAHAKKWTVGVEPDTRVLGDSMTHLALGAASVRITNMATRTVEFGWTAGKGMSMVFGFEAAGREMKGYLATTGAPADGPMTDADLDNAHIALPFQAFRDGVGGLTFSVIGHPTSTALVTPTGNCSVLGNTVCDMFAAHFQKAAEAVADGFGWHITSAQATTFANAIHSVLVGYGIGFVRSVTVDGDSLVIVY